MFRKFAHITFLLIWSITTIGFTISRHYCGDILVSVKINHETKSCCGMDCDCCHNENDRFVLENDYKSEQELSLPSIPEYDNLFSLNYSYISNIPVREPVQITYYRQTHPPPAYDVILSELQTFLC